MTIRKKKCTKCKVVKSFSEFYKLHCSPDGYQHHCKDCAKAYTQTEAAREAQKRYNQTDYRKEAKKRYRESDKGKENTSRYNKLRNQTEKARSEKRQYAQSERGKQVRLAYDRLRSRREGVKAKRSRYKKSPYGRQEGRKHSAIRRSRKAQVQGNYTVSEWFNLCEFYSFFCLKCNKKFPFDKLTVDHVTPISKGGSNFIWNLQPLCIKCNSSKGDKEIDYREILPQWINRSSPVWIQSSLFLNNHY